MGLCDTIYEAVHHLEKGSGVGAKQEETKKIRKETLKTAKQRICALARYLKI